MVRPNQVQTWVLGVALLAGGEFSYAHLRHLGLWPLELMMGSMWRLAAVLVAAGFPSGALWAAPVALAVGALLVLGIAAWSKRRHASERRNHE